MPESPSAPAHIGYYVHHHGIGHQRRATAIAEQLQTPVTLIGSQLPESPLAPHISRLLLPADTAPGMHLEVLPGLHYAPLAVPGLRMRMGMLSDWLRDSWPCLLVVDVSVEVALLARLFGVPSVYIRQHGQRDDPAHLQAYACASRLLAPYPQPMENRDTPATVLGKTRYSGWLCRYPQGRKGRVPQPYRVLVIIGQGGTALGFDGLTQLARSCPEYQFRIAGLSIPAPAGGPGNLVWLGRLDEPYTELCDAELVIGSAGDSLVAEVASLGCRYIAVAEPRPFAEQRYQARRLQQLGVAIGLEGWPPGYHWPGILQRARLLDPHLWQQWGTAQGAERAARIIEATWREQFDPEQAGPPHR